MAKYWARVEVIKTEKQVIEIEANSKAEADFKIRQLMKEENKCYSYLPVGDDESFKIKSITKLEEDEND